MATESTETEPLILVVDDERAIREMIDLLLSGEGYNVVTAASGFEALAIVQQRPVDLIIVDLRMPGLHGDAVCRRYREQGGNAAVLLLTGAETAAAIVDACGANGYIAKPFDIDLVVETVAQYLGTRPRQ